METKFNFNSQICTNKIQSERLLALGLRSNTADCMIITKSNYVKHEPRVVLGYDNVLADTSGFEVIPAWSLYRLIEMLRSRINISKDLPSINHDAYLRMHKASVSYIWFNCDGEEKILVGFYDDGFFGAVVDAIEWLIKEGYFNKEYLV